MQIIPILGISVSQHFVYDELVLVPLTNQD